ncbi:MAG: glycosyltransferase [Candidatus Eisenbacteria sp.]|nr:glycosyltransferase [Candidatus Eisenbacteria bacterium]
MKILFVATEIPSPEGGGGLIANYYHLRGLIEAGHRVVLVCLVPGGVPADAPRIEGVERTVLVPGVSPTTTWRFFSNLFEKEPVPIRKYMRVKAGSVIRSLDEEYRFDVAHLASLHTAHLLESRGTAARYPVVLYEHNIQSRVHELFYHMQRRAGRRWYARLQWRKMLKYEAEVCGRLDRVLTFSEADADALSALSPRSRVSWLPLSVDALSLSEISAAEDIDLLWIGSLRWLPNVDSLEWFVDEILPRILHFRPMATVAIAGSSPPPWLKSIAQRGPGIRILGEVENAHDLMARSRIVLVPLRIGSGVRVKIIEALAMKRAVLSTTLGCEGIEVEPGKHLVVADEPDDFAREAIRLLEDENRRRELGARGQELVLARHDYRKVGQEMSALYQSLAGSAR